MAYVKPFKVIQDTYVTLDDWNELQDSDLASLTTIAAKHLVEEDAEGLAEAGEHNDLLVPYLVIHVAVELYGSVVTAKVDAADGASVDSVVLERLGTGLYRVSAPELFEDDKLSFGHVGCETGNTANIDAQDARANFNDGSGNEGAFVGFEIELLGYNSSSSTWVADDFNFTLTVFRKAGGTP